jgi:hypothetical protein
VSLSFPARAACDRCATEATLAVTIAKLAPVTMFLALPDGWTVSTKADSGELKMTCPTCVGRDSLLPQAPAPKFAVEPLTNPASPESKKMRTVKPGSE